MNSHCVIGDGSLVFPRSLTGAFAPKLVRLCIVASRPRRRFLENSTCLDSTPRHLNT